MTTHFLNLAVKRFTATLLSLSLIGTASDFSMASGVGRTTVANPIFDSEALDATHAWYRSQANQFHSQSGLERVIRATYQVVSALPKENPQSADAEDLEFLAQDAELKGARPASARQRRDWSHQLIELAENVNDENPIAPVVFRDHPELEGMVRSFAVALVQTPERLDIRYAPGAMSFHSSLTGRRATAFIRDEVDGNGQSHRVLYIARYELRGLLREGILSNGATAAQAQLAQTIVPESGMVSGKADLPNRPDVDQASKLLATAFEAPTDSGRRNAAQQLLRLLANQATFHAVMAQFESRDRASYERLLQVFIALYADAADRRTIDHIGKYFFDSPRRFERAYDVLAEIEAWRIRHPIHPAGVNDGWIERQLMAGAPAIILAMRNRHYVPAIPRHATERSAVSLARLQRLATTWALVNDSHVRLLQSLLNPRNLRTRRARREVLNRVNQEVQAIEHNIRRLTELTKQNSHTPEARILTLTLTDAIQNDLTALQPGYFRSILFGQEWRNRALRSLEFHLQRLRDVGLDELDAADMSELMLDLGRPAAVEVGPKATTGIRIFTVVLGALALTGLVYAAVHALVSGDSRAAQQILAAIPILSFPTRRHFLKSSLGAGAAAALSHAGIAQTRSAVTASSAVEKETRQLLHDLARRRSQRNFIDAGQADGGAEWIEKFANGRLFFSSTDDSHLPWTITLDRDASGAFLPMFGKGEEGHPAQQWPVTLNMTPAGLEFLRAAAKLPPFDRELADFMAWMFLAEQVSKRGLQSRFGDRGVSNLGQVEKELRESIEMALKPLRNADGSWKPELALQLNDKSSLGQLIQYYVTVLSRQECVAMVSVANWIDPTTQLAARVNDFAINGLAQRLPDRASTMLQTMWSLYQSVPHDPPFPSDVSTLTDYQRRNPIYRFELPQSVALEMLDRLDTRLPGIFGDRTLVPFEKMVIDLAHRIEVHHGRYRAAGLAGDVTKVYMGYLRLIDDEQLNLSYLRRRYAPNAGGVRPAPQKPWTARYEDSEDDDDAAIRFVMPDTYMAGMIRYKLGRYVLLKWIFMPAKRKYIEDVVVYAAYPIKHSQIRAGDLPEDLKRKIEEDFAPNWERITILLPGSLERHRDLYPAGDPRNAEVRERRRAGIRNIRLAVTGAFFVFSAAAAYVVKGSALWAENPWQAAGLAFLAVAWLALKVGAWVHRRYNRQNPDAPLTFQRSETASPSENHDLGTLRKSLVRYAHHFGAIRSHDAEDLAQETLLRAYHAAGDQYLSKPKAYYRRILANIAYDRQFRSTNALDWSVDSSTSDDEDDADVIAQIPDDSLTAEEALQQIDIYTKVHYLPDHLRQAVVGLMHDEALEDEAQRLQVPKSTIRNWRHRGIQRLHQLWEMGILTFVLMMGVTLLLQHPVPIENGLSAPVMIATIPFLALPRAIARRNLWRRGFLTAVAAAGASGLFAGVIFRTLMPELLGLRDVRRHEMQTLLFHVDTVLKRLVNVNRFVDPAAWRLIAADIELYESHLGKKSFGVTQRLHLVLPKNPKDSHAAVDDAKIISLFHELRQALVDDLKAYEPEFAPNSFPDTKIASGTNPQRPSAATPTPVKAMPFLLFAMQTKSPNELWRSVRRLPGVRGGLLVLGALGAHIALSAALFRVAPRLMAAVLPDTTVLGAAMLLALLSVMSLTVWLMAQHTWPDHALSKFLNKMTLRLYHFIAGEESSQASASGSTLDVQGMSRQVLGDERHYSRPTVSA